MGELARAVKHFQVREATARSLVRRLATGWSANVDSGMWVNRRKDREPMTPAEAALYREWTAPDDGDRGECSTSALSPQRTGAAGE